MAKKQVKKNRDTYNVNRARILNLAKQSSTAIKGFEVGLPILENLQSEIVLDPIGGLDPFDAEGDLDGFDFL